MSTGVGGLMPRPAYRPNELLAALDAEERARDEAAALRAAAAPPAAPAAPAPEPEPARVCVLVLLGRLGHARPLSKVEKTLVQVIEREWVGRRRGERVWPLFACAGCARCRSEARRGAEPPEGLVTRAVLYFHADDGARAHEDAMHALRGLAAARAGRARLADDLGGLGLLTVGWVNSGCPEDAATRSRFLVAAPEPAALKRPRSPSVCSPPPVAHWADAGAPAEPAAPSAARARALAPGSAPAPRGVRNRHLAGPLEELAALYRKIQRNYQDPFRAVAFGKAAKLLLAWPAEISGPEEYETFAAAVRAAADEAHRRARERGAAGGPSSVAPVTVLKPDGAVCEVICQMLSGPVGGERARCARLRDLLKDAKVRSVLCLSQVYAIGPSTARRLYDLGLRTLDDLREDAAKPQAESKAQLTPHQRVGLRCAADFAKRIPRAEVERIEATVRAALVALVGEARVQFCEPVGSYRRGRPHSGDADILLCVAPAEAEGAGSAGGAAGSQDSHEARSGGGVLALLVRALRESGFITDVLAMPSGSSPARASGSGSGAGPEARCQSFMGVCRPEPDGPFRRLDIKLYPRALLPFALLYFTGSDFFNRSMRHYAKLKGFTLSDNGLEHRTGAKRSVSPPCLCEADVFARLGLEWREPNDRELQVTPIAAGGAAGAAEPGGVDEFCLLVDGSEHGAPDVMPSAGADSDDDDAIADLLREPPAAQHSESCEAAGSDATDD